MDNLTDIFLKSKSKPIGSISPDGKRKKVAQPDKWESIKKEAEEAEKYFASKAGKEDSLIERLKNYNLNFAEKLKRWIEVRNEDKNTSFLSGKDVHLKGEKVFNILAENSCLTNKNNEFIGLRRNGVWEINTMFETFIPNVEKYLAEHGGEINYHTKDGAHRQAIINSVTKEITVQQHKGNVHYTNEKTFQYTWEDLHKDLNFAKDLRLNVGKSKKMALMENSDWKDLFDKVPNFSLK